jgi:hypothetical protein
MAVRRYFCPRKKSRTRWARIVRGQALEEAKRAKKAAEDEEAAAERIKYARKLLDRGEDTEAKNRLKKLIANYPETKTASEAKEVLKRLDK